jgi:uncharacterized peroxidase-related enzyme
MSFIDTTRPHAARDAVADMYRRQQAAWGYVPNYAKAFCHRPEVLKRWGQLLAQIKRPMDRRRFELVTFVAAHQLKHSACALAHGKALREMFTDEAIVSIAEGRTENVLGDAEQAIVRFARQVAADASQVTAADVAALRELGCTDAEVFDVAAAAAGRAFFTKLLEAMGVQADAPFQAIEESMRRALMNGRAIDTADCETLPPPGRSRSRFPSIRSLLRMLSPTPDQELNHD